MKLIGNKNHIAISFKVTDVRHLMGYAKVWFGGKFIGTSKDLIYLKGYLITMLRQIKDSKEANFSISNKNEIFGTLYRRLSALDDSYKYLVSGGTFTDDFIIFSFCDENFRIHITWKLMQRNTGFNDLKNVSDEIHYFTMSYTDFDAFFNKATIEILGYEKRFS